MHYKLLLLSTIFSLCVSPTIMAEQSTSVCSRKAIARANNQYLQEISSYISLFSNQRHYALVTELSQIKPLDSFKQKHAQEIRQFNNKNYQPSQEFCDDAYQNLDNLRQQITEVIKKYEPKEES